MKGKIEVECFDSNATAFATFQSHNRKIVTNEKGCFLTYIKSRNEPYTQQNLRLINALTGRLIYDVTLATNPAPLETDDMNNLYIVYPDFVSKDSYFVIFKAEDDYTDPVKIKLENTYGGKFAMAFDRKNKLFYYMPNNGDIKVLDTTGKLIYSGKVVVRGKESSYEYPHLDVDENSVLHLSWTTDLYNTYHYLSIYYMRSYDNGRTWRRMDDSPVTIPAASDDDLGATRITDDYEYDKNKFLAAFCVNDGKAHFMYRANPHPDFKVAKDDFHNGIQRYKRYDLKTGKRDIDLARPFLEGSDIKLAFFDGFFCKDRRQGKNALYFIAKQGTRLGCLVSYDNAVTWSDYGISDEIADDTYSIYATGGANFVSDDGYIYGTFTKRIGDFSDIFVRSEAYLIKIKAQ